MAFLVVVNGVHLVHDGRMLREQVVLVVRKAEAAEPSLLLRFHVVGQFARDGVVRILFHRLLGCNGVVVNAARDGHHHLVALVSFR